ncbi:hypothetical protein MMPV_000584 [Pyropia vietnamensis]
MASHTIITGETGNTYTLLEKIGSGAYGTVYKGLWQQLGRHVAVKRVATGRFSVDEERALRSEIELFKNLKHPHIVNYVEAVHSSDDYLDIVMEYVEGGSLFAVINHIRRSLPPDAVRVFAEPVAAAFARQVLIGLTYLHDQGVVHRDIKCANLLVTKESFVKLADFGVSANKPASASAAQDVAGTPHWMAPEIITQSGFSTASDIWSVGATVIELLTGLPPYSDLSGITALFRIVSDDRPPLPSDLSADAAHFLLRCFDKDMHSRATATELLNHSWLAAAAALMPEPPAGGSKLRRRQVGEPSLGSSEWDGSSYEPDGQGTPAAVSSAPALLETGSGAATPSPFQCLSAYCEGEEDDNFDDMLGDFDDGAFPAPSSDSTLSQERMRQSDGDLMSSMIAPSSSSHLSDRLLKLDLDHVSSHQSTSVPDSMFDWEESPATSGLSREPNSSAPASAPPWPEPIFDDADALADVTLTEKPAATPEDYPAPETPVRSGGGSRSVATSKLSQRLSTIGTATPAGAASSADGVDVSSGSLPPLGPAPLLSHPSSFRRSRSDFTGGARVPVGSGSGGSGGGRAGHRDGNTSLSGVGRGRPADVDPFAGMGEDPEAAAERARAAAERANWARARAAMLALDGPPATAAVAADTLVHILREHPEQGAALMYEPGLIPLLELLERGDATDERRTIALLNIALALAYTSCGNEPPPERCYLDDDLLNDRWLSVDTAGGDASFSSGSGERMVPSQSTGHHSTRSVSLDFLPIPIGAAEGASRPGAAVLSSVSSPSVTDGVVRDIVVRQVAANAVATGMNEPCSPKSGRTSLGGEELIAALETGSTPSPWKADPPESSGGGGPAGPVANLRSRVRGAVAGPPLPTMQAGGAGGVSVSSGQLPLRHRDVGGGVGGGGGDSGGPSLPAVSVSLPPLATSPGVRSFAAPPRNETSAPRLSPGVRAAWSVPSGALGSYPPVRDVREDLCLAGFLPVAMRLCDRRRPAAVRLRAAQLLDVVLELPSTLQMLVACRGFTVYVDMLSDGVNEDRVDGMKEDPVDGDGGHARPAAPLLVEFPLPSRQRRLRVMIWELWELALRGINRMLNMESGRYKRDFCRRFAWYGLLEPIAAALLRTGQGGRLGLLPDAATITVKDDSSASPYEHRIVGLARLLQSFAARADSVVKARMATAEVLEPMIAALQQGTPVDADARVNGWTGGGGGGESVRPELDAATVGEESVLDAPTVRTSITTPLLGAQAGSLPAGPASSLPPPDAPQPSLPTAAREALFNCLRDLSRDPLTHEALTSAGALRVLVGELGRPSTSVELARCVVSSVCDLCMVSAERQEAAAVAGLVPHLEVAIRSNDVNLSAVCISIYSGLALAGPRSRSALSAASGVDTYTQLLSSSTTLARWQARTLSSLAEWLDVDAAHVEARLASTTAVNHIVVCMSRLQLRHAEAMLEPYRALVASSRVVNKALGGRRTLIRLFTRWLSPPGWTAAAPPSAVADAAYPRDTIAPPPSTAAAAAGRSAAPAPGDESDWAGGGGPRVRLLLLRILLAHARQWTPDTVAFQYARRELGLDGVAAAMAADDAAIPVREQALLLSGQLDALRGCN